MEQITSKDNALIKKYVKLSLDKGFRDTCGLFTVEGIKLCLDVQSEKIEIIFVTQTAYEKYYSELEKLFQVKIFLIDTALVKKMSQSKTSQEIFAIVQKKNEILDMKKLGDGHYLMLCDLQDSVNVGALFRTALALNFNGVILTQQCCDIYNHKTIRASMGAVLKLPVHYCDDISETIMALHQYGVTTIASVLDNSAIDIKCLQKSVKSVLLIGNEGNGLDENVVSICDTTVTIKMNSKAESLNASVAGAILMWEIVKGE